MNMRVDQVQVDLTMDESVDENQRDKIRESSTSQN